MAEAVQLSDYNPHPAGAQWRKWDLHVHTPASFHWKGGKLLRDMNDDEMATTFDDLYRSLDESDIAAFSITDYWTFDGYLKFLGYLRNRELDPPRTVFPGIELRVEAPVDYRLNLQVILSDSLTPQQLIDFRSQLRVRSIDRRISDESIMEFARSLDASKAAKHGYGPVESLDDIQLLQLGQKTIEVTKSSLEEAVLAVPRGSAFIIMPYDTSDGLVNLDWATQPHADNYFMQSAQIFESRDQATMDLFQGIKTDDNESFIDNFQKTLGNVEKPVICGSDAHRYSEYGKYPNKRATWIKADPTWDGFRQIIYEPRERVRIQELKPETKTPYMILDKVRFIDQADGGIFPPDWIHLNDQLNVVIGGKSSGKSLLLYHIAKSITPELVRQRSQEIEIPKYRFGDQQDIDFEVAWNDGRLDRLSQPSDNGEREIEYVPQMYVNSLAEKGGRASLFHLIESILEQNAEYRLFVQDVRSSISALEAEIEQDATTLLNLRDEHRRLTGERKSIGDAEAIDKEITRLQGEVDSLRKESGFTEEEELAYQSLAGKHQALMARRRQWRGIALALVELANRLRKLDMQAQAEFRSYSSDIQLDGLAQRVIRKCINTAISLIQEAYAMSLKGIEGVRQQSLAKAESLGGRLDAISEQIRPYSDKIKNQKLLAQLEGQLNEQRTKRELYDTKTKEIERTTQNGQRARESLVGHYTSLLDHNQNIETQLKMDEYAKIDEEIVLKAELGFDDGTFHQAFGELFDRRTRLRAAFGSAFSDSDSFQFDAERHVDVITAIFDELSRATDTKFSLRKNITSGDAIRSLFGNYFKIEYGLQYKGDDILEMSPGKRGLVLLQLILHISNATHPILIDQPEDNLDNRTISGELNRFIRNKKKARQIIMVTHDANLVVLTDAENVVVSNQGGQQPGRENAKCQFEYVTGALEHSFSSAAGTTPGILQSVGIREHVVDVLEGGEEAFRKREQRYGLVWR